MELHNYPSVASVATDAIFEVNNGEYYCIALTCEIHLVAGRLGFYSQSGHTKDFKNSIRNFRAKRSAEAEVRRVLCMCCSSCYVP